MLVHRRRRSTSINPTLGPCILFAGRICHCQPTLQKKGGLSIISTLDRFSSWILYTDISSSKDRTPVDIGYIVALFLSLDMKSCIYQLYLPLCEVADTPFHIKGTNYISHTHVPRIGRNKQTFNSRVNLSTLYGDDTIRFPSRLVTVYISLMPHVSVSHGKHLSSPICCITQ